MREYKKWNDEDRDTAIALWTMGKTIKVIAEELGREVNSVASLIYRLQRKGILPKRSKGAKASKKGKDSKMNAKKYLEEMASSMREIGTGTPFPQPKQPSSANKIRDTCNELCDLLLAKNRAYGDSAFAPIRIFSKSDASEQLKVRIDDKLNRLLQGDTLIETDEDVIKDLVGYLVLLLINMRE